MTSGQKWFPWILIVAGMSGLCLFQIGNRSGLPIIPTQDFAKGLWFGVCIGAEILGGLLLIKGRGKPVG